MTALSVFALLETCVIAFLGWIVSQTIYNLCFHPLSGFPGPKLAAVSRWYEFYFDVFKRPGGQFPPQIEHLHRKYGPIVRIGPNELHVNDASFFDKIYATGSRRDKSPYFADMFAIPTALISTVDHDLHKTRRAALNPYFSKRSVTQLESIITAKVSMMCNEIGKFKSQRKILSIRPAFSAAITDIITEYSFAQQFRALDDSTKWFEWDNMILGPLETVPLTRHFPSILRSLLALPLPIVHYFSPASADYLRLFGRVRENLLSIFTRYCEHRDEFSSIESKERQNDGKHLRTIFHEILFSSLPDHEKTLEHLTDEAVAVVSAASQTTVTTLSTAIYHIFSTPLIHKRLKSELREAMPDACTLKEWRELEALPYLTACIKEALRMAAPVSSRVPLILPTPLLYTSPAIQNVAGKSQAYEIPPKTIIGMSPRMMLHNADVYPDPERFDPTRWLTAENISPSELSEDGSKQKSARYTDPKAMEQSYKPFGGGPRMCIGINLAYANLYHILAAVVRRLDLEITDTVRARDVDMNRDHFVPMVARGSQGVRVRVIGDEAE